MFQMTVTNADGTTEVGTASEAEASVTLRRALRLGYRVEATRQGGAVIVRDILGSADYWTPPRHHTVTLEPVTPAGTVTAAQRRDLGVIAGRRAGAWMTGDYIHAGLYSVPRAATARLVQRGLVTVDGTAVSVSLAARLAMLAQDHHTETREPRGYVYPSDIGKGHITIGSIRPGGRSGRVYDRSSVASCSCRRWSYPCESRDDARRRAHLHCQEAAAVTLRALFTTTE